MMMMRTLWVFWVKNPHWVYPIQTVYADRSMSRNGTRDPFLQRLQSLWSDMSMSTWNLPVVIIWWVLAVNFWYEMANEGLLVEGGVVGAKEVVPGTVQAVMVYLDRKTGI
jgi:hypothetical protein